MKRLTVLCSIILTFVLLAACGKGAITPTNTPTKTDSTNQTVEQKEEVKPTESAPETEKKEISAPVASKKKTTSVAKKPNSKPAVKPNTNEGQETSPLVSDKYFCKAATQDELNEYIKTGDCIKRIAGENQEKAYAERKEIFKVLGIEDSLTYYFPDMNKLPKGYGNCQMYINKAGALHISFDYIPAREKNLIGEHYISCGISFKSSEETKKYGKEMMDQAKEKIKNKNERCSVQTVNGVEYYISGSPASGGDFAVWSIIWEQYGEIHYASIGQNDVPLDAVLPFLNLHPVTVKIEK